MASKHNLTTKEFLMPHIVYITSVFPLGIST